MSNSDAPTSIVANRSAGRTWQAGCGMMFDLSSIDSALLDLAIQAINERDAERLLSYLDNTKHFDFLWSNQKAFHACGLFERAVVEAWTSTRTNHVWRYAEWHFLFSCADASRLKTAGDPMPACNSLYRGIAGQGVYRRPFGFSWTADMEKAQWFARRLSRLSNPHVIEIPWPSDNEILFYSDQRGEQEYVLRLDGPPKGTKRHRIQLSDPGKHE